MAVMMLAALTASIVVSTSPVQASANRDTTFADTTDADTTVADTTAADTAEIASGASIAYVASRTPPADLDRRMLRHLRFIGANVRVIDDDEAAATDFSGFDLIYLATSSRPNTIGSLFIDTPIPLITDEHLLLDDMKMARGPIRQVFTDEVTITAPDSPLAAGLSGTVTVNSSPSLLGIASAGPDATVVATVNGRSAIFAYATGAPMVRNAVAPAPRAYVTGAMRTAGRGNRNYFALVDAAIQFLLEPPPVAIDDRYQTNSRQVLTASGTHEFGERGINPGRFRFPDGVAAGRAGEIVVADTGNDRIQICDRAGQCSTLGEFGFDAGEFVAPDDVVVHGAQLLIADTGNHRVQICDRSGECEAFGEQGSDVGEFNSPTGIAVDHYDNVLVADTGNDRVQICGIEGHCRTFGTRGGGAGEFRQPSGVAYSHDGSIIVIDTGNRRAQLCDRVGGCTVVDIGPIEQGRPTGVSVGPDGSVFVVGNGAFGLRVCDRDLRMCAPADGGDGAPSGADVSIDAQGDVIVVDDHGHRVLVASRDGVLANDEAPRELMVIAHEAVSSFGAKVDIDADGTLRYDPTTSARLGALEPGDVVVDSFAYTAATADGQTSTATVSVTVTGTHHDDD